MFGFYASLAAAALSEVEARLQDQANQSAQQDAFEDHMAMLQRQARRHQSDVIDVEAREVPEALALPAPVENATPTRDSVGITERDDEQ